MSKVEQLELKLSTDPFVDFWATLFAGSGFSSTIELFDRLPLYGGQRTRDEVRTIHLPFRPDGHPSNRPPIHLEFSLWPAQMKKVPGRSRTRALNVQPGLREQHVESVVRLLAIEQYQGELTGLSPTIRGGERERKEQLITVISLYDIKACLNSLGHDYKYAQIREAIEILRSVNISLEASDGNPQGKNWDCAKQPVLWSMRIKKGTDERKEYYRFEFHPLVRGSIFRKSYMRYDYVNEHTWGLRSLSTWLYRRISHAFRQASSLDCYRIALSSIVEEGPIGEQRLFRNYRKPVEAAWAELGPQGETERLLVVPNEFTVLSATNVTDHEKGALQKHLVDEQPYIAVPKYRKSGEGRGRGSLEDVIYYVWTSESHRKGLLEYYQLRKEVERTVDEKDFDAKPLPGIF